MLDRHWFRRYARWLRKTFPPPRPVRIERIRQVRLAKPPHAVCGDTIFAHGRFTIRLERRYHPIIVYDTLLHEWAHVLTWNGADAWLGEDHGPEWGIAYARIFTAFCKWGDTDGNTQSGSNL